MWSVERMQGDRSRLLRVWGKWRAECALLRCAVGRGSPKPALARAIVGDSDRPAWRSLNKRYPD